MEFSWRDWGKSPEILSEDSQYQDQDFSSGPTKYEAWLLPTQVWRCFLTLLYVQQPQRIVSDGGNATTRAPTPDEQQNRHMKIGKETQVPAIPSERLLQQWHTYWVPCDVFQTQRQTGLLTRGQQQQQVPVAAICTNRGRSHFVNCILVNLALFNAHYALRSHRCLYIIQVHLKITRHLSALTK